MQKKSAAVFSCFYGYHTDLGSEAPSSSSQEESIHNPLSSLDIPSHTKIKIWNSAQHYLSDLSAICKSPSAGWWRTHRARGLTMSSYQRVTDTYVTVTALPISLQRFAPIQLQLESVLKWFKSQKAQLNLTKLAERKKGPHQKASTKKGTKYIRDMLSQAEESSFRTRALRQTPTSTSSIPSQPSKASHHSSMASQQTPMVNQQTSMASQQTPMVTQQLSTNLKR